MKKHSEDLPMNLSLDLRRCYELSTCPCTHCLDDCESLETVYSCPKYNEWFDMTMERREHENQQRRHNQETERDSG